MLQPGGQLDLALEPFGPDGGREIGMENLDRDLSVVTLIGRQINRSHTAPSQFTLDLVTVPNSFL
jgi:hypothetical protein